MTIFTKQQPTLIMKLLGSNYKYLYLFLYGFKANTAYLLNDILWFFGLSIMNFAWFYTIKIYSNPEVLNEVFLANLISIFLVSYVIFNIGSANKGGSISTLLIQPVNFLYRFFFFRLGDSIKGFTINIILYFLMGLYFNISLNLQNLLSFLLLIPLIIITAFLIESCFSFIVFWSIEHYGISEIFYSISSIASGRVIPISIIYSSVIMQFQPFAFISYFPINIILNRYNSFIVLLLIMANIFWIILLHFLANHLIKIGLKKNEAVGL